MSSWLLISFVDLSVISGRLKGLIFTKKKRILSRKIKQLLEKKERKKEKDKRALCVQLRTIYYQVNKKNKEVTKFRRKTQVAKINCYFSDRSKKLNQVIMIKLFRKNTGSLMNYKELIHLLRTKLLVLTTRKEGVSYEWKKDLEDSLRRKTSLRKTCSLLCQEYSE